MPVLHQVMVTNSDNIKEKSQINNLTLHLKQLEKEEMENPRVKERNLKT